MAMFVILCVVAFFMGASPAQATGEKQPATNPTVADNDLYLQLLSRVQHIEQHGNEQQAETNKRIQLLEQRDKAQQADINKRVQLLEQRDKEQQADINKRVQLLEQRDKEQQAETNKRVQLLEQRDKEQQTAINKLRTELQTGRRRTSVLERKVLELTIRGNKDNEKAGDEVERPQHLDTSAGSVKDIGGNDSTRKHEVKRRTMIKRQENIAVVAFHANLKTSVQHVGMQQMVHFDNVRTNIGNAYNPHFGAFVAPVSGVYVFHTTITGYDHHVLHVSIVKNNGSVASFYIRGVESSFGNGSAMAVLHLNKGDDVAIRNNDADKGIHTYWMFSGFLLHEDHPTESIVGK